MKLHIKQSSGNINLQVKCSFIARTDGNGLWNNAMRDVRVTGFKLYVDNSGDEMHGDLGIQYDETTWDNKRDGLIYTDKAFIKTVRKKLVLLLGNTGNEVNYSEQGMQDDGRVSCDVGDGLIARVRELAAL